MIQLFINNFETTLAADCTAVATALTLTSATGLPSPVNDEFFYLTLYDGSDYEIVKVTSRSGTVVTVVRAQQGTTGTAFSAADLVGAYVTTGDIDRRAEKLITSGNVYAAHRQMLVSDVIDLTQTATDNLVTFDMPGTGHFYPLRCGVIMDSIDTLTSHPSVSFGITGNTVLLLASTALTLTAAYQIEDNAVLAPDGLTEVTMSLKTAGVATTYDCKVYVTGYFIED